MVFSVYGFAMGHSETIRHDELFAFRRLAGETLSYDDKALEAATRNGTIMEIRRNG